MRLPVLLGLIFAWLILTALYPMIAGIPEKSNYILEILKSLPKSVPVCGVLFTVLLMSFNSLETSSNIRDSKIFNRDINSFKLLDRWDEPLLQEVRKITREWQKKRSETSDNDLTAKIEANEDKLEDSLIAMSNFFETIYLQVENNTVNEVLLKSAFKEIYIDIFKRFENVWFEKKKDGGTGKNLIALKKRWENNA
jgi:hypothetical protein